MSKSKIQDIDQEEEEEDESTEPEDNIDSPPLVYKSKYNNNNDNDNNKKRSSTSQIINVDDDDDTEPEDLDETFTQPFKSIKSTATTTSTTSTKKTKIDQEYDDDLEYAIQQSLLDHQKEQQQQKSNNTFTTSSSSSSSSFSSGESFYLNRIYGESNDNNSSTTPKTLTFRDIISPSGLESVIAMGFGMDTEWMMNEIIRSQKGRKDIPMTFVIDCGDPKKKGTTVIQNITLILVHVLYGCMHSKLILLLYKDYIRVVVPSANPFEEDYIRIGQTIWYQDFQKKLPPPPPPLATTPTLKPIPSTSKTISLSLKQMTTKKPTTTTTTTTTNDFQISLKTLLNCFKIETKFLDQFDFECAKAQLIISIPGFHNGATLNSYGHLKLRSVLTSYYNQKEKDLNLKIDNFKRDVFSQCSSLGNVNSGWNQHFLESCRIPKNNLEDISKSLHILFPTVSWITSNHKRMQSASIIRFQDKSYDDKTFPRNSMTLIKHRHPHRGNMLLHTKVNVGVTTIGKNKRYDWIYVGSHNLSPAAWGKIQKNQTQIQLSNYEIGVVLLNDRLYNDFEPPCWVDQIPFNIPSTPYSSTDKPFIIDSFVASHQ
ncbi:protein-tyrosine phosphatase 3 [Cavenderia fasciculata]|uniref:Protein-tyrosine phosphatase 3 n=1 Tax=Cavenderia fasciculata TaxID=261658 RepID=F4Q7L1_CACFS|nr:protein-tyrosine phosphatase 3 [Cavenderia fasciculata]EGG16393.1 protein-tyrosine phosphatase 3 [Cavenderia fasciculata]|eukprot:XP_004354777.1 protein-tyrosine phosphatase 3 [Cavenderia fasciculata]